MMNRWHRTAPEKWAARLVSIWMVIFMVSFKLLVFPFFYYLLSVRSRRNDDRAHLINRWWAGFILMITGIRVTVYGRHHLRSNQPFVYVPNHNSYLDIPVSYLVFPGSFRFIGKKELNKVPLFGWMYERLYITVNRSSRLDAYRSFVKAADKLKEGISIVIYPEGTIARNKQVLSPFKEGAFRVAVETQRPIVPVALIYTDRVLPDDRQFLVYPGKIQVVIHEPIPTVGLTEADVEMLKNKVHTILFNTLAPYYGPANQRSTH